MPSARELLQQADALMRRNRARAIDTDIPELTEVVAEVAPGSPAAVIALDDLPELVDAVEEIEIASIVELPDNIDDASGWLHHDSGDWSVIGREVDSILGRLPMASAPGSPAGTAGSLLTVGGKPGEDIDRTPELGPAPTAAESAPPAAESVPPAVESPPPVVEPPPPAVEPPPPAVEPPPPAVEPAPPTAAASPIADDSARWDVLAEEIQRQVLQRIGIFTDTRLRKQLGAQLQPMVDRASVQMVETISDEIGKLLRAHVAEAIEREIDKWRGRAD